MNTGILSETKNPTATQQVLQRAVGLARVPIIISLFITPIRFTLELSGLPENAIFLIGVLWLTLGFSIYWGIKLYKEKQSYLILLLTLVFFAPISRLPVAFLWWLDTKFEIGTHYGLYFNNFPEALLNQVGYGSLVQIIPGFLVGSITLALMQYRKSAKQ